MLVIIFPGFDLTCVPSVPILSNWVYASVSLSRNPSYNDILKLNYIKRRMNHKSNNILTACQS